MLQPKLQIINLTVKPILSMRSKNYFILALFVFSLYACSKTSNSRVNNCVSTNGVPTTAEVDSLQRYLTSKSITATKDSRGFFVETLGAGYGIDNPLPNSNVTVKYKGTLTNGTVFDSTATGTTASFPLGGVILGWQYAIPQMKKGAIINLYLPPSLGYGCSASSKIPTSSILIFRVELVNF